MVPEVDMSVTVTPSREEMAQEEVKGVGANNGCWR